MTIITHSENVKQYLTNNPMESGVDHSSVCCPSLSRKTRLIDSRITVYQGCHVLRKLPLLWRQTTFQNSAQSTSSWIFAKPHTAPPALRSLYIIPLDSIYLHHVTPLVAAVERFARRGKSKQLARSTYFSVASLRSVRTGAQSIIPASAPSSGSWAVASLDLDWIRQSRCWMLLLLFRLNETTLAPFCVPLG